MKNTNNSFLFSNGGRELVCSSGIEPTKQIFHSGKSVGPGSSAYDISLYQHHLDCVIVAEEHASHLSEGLGHGVRVVGHALTRLDYVYGLGPIETNQLYCYIYNGP